MANKKIKVSELTPATSLMGYYAFGYKSVGGKSTSVKLDLSYIQTAYEKTVEATGLANKAAGAANKAASDANTQMAQISQEASQVIKDANTAASNVQDGKTTQFDIGTVESGTKPSASLTDDGADPAGNPKKKLNLVMPKADNAKSPTVETGTITTGDPGSEVTATFTEVGTTQDGRPIWRVDGSIPRGQQGLPGNGSGNVSADGAGLILGKKYLFVPNADGSTSGTFAEYVPHTSYMLVFGANKAIQADAFAQISNAFNTGGEVLVKFTNGSVYKPGSIDIENNVATLKMFNFGNDYITIEVTDGVTTAEMYSNKVVIDADITKKIDAHNISPDAHQDIRQKITDVESIARGRAKAIVFNTVADLDAWLAVTANVVTLQIGDNLYIRALDAPGYWWDGVKKQPIEGEKVDLSGYVEEAPIDGKPYNRKDGVWVKSSIDLSKENIESLLTGNIATHTHDGGIQVLPLQTDVWDGTTISTALSGIGTKEDPYLIESCADYIHFYNNPNLYSTDVNAGMPDHAKSIKITHNLDFNNNLVDFTDYISAFTSEEALLSKGLILAVIEGCGCQLSNLNFINTWSVLPLLYMSCVKDVNVVSGILSVDIAKIEALSSLTGESEASLCIIGLIPMVSTTSGCSCRACIKFVGTLSQQNMYNICAFSLIGEANKTLIELGVDIPSKNSGYSEINFQTECDTSTFILIVNYNPAMVSLAHGLSGLSMTVYDCSNTVEVDMSTEPAPGFYPMMIADSGLYNDPYILYLNSDTTHIMYGNTSQPIIQYHIYKSTEEMQSGTFLILLNTTSDCLFIEDISGLNKGYPVFLSGAKEIYEGYVGMSLFMQNIPYYVDFDFTGTLYELTPSDFPALKRQYEEPTKENLQQVLGWTGILNLINAAERGQMITFPMKEAYLLGTTTCIYVSANKTLIDDLYMFYFISYLPNKKRLSFTLFVQPSTREITNFSISVSDTEIEVTNSLNDTTSSKALSAYAGSVLNQKKVESTDVSVIKKLTQAEYDALTQKDDKTLYLIVG